MEPEKPKIGPAQLRLCGMVLLFAIAALYYKIIVQGNYYDSAALYIGMPLILAVGLSLMPTTRSALGATMKGMTLALLLSALVFNEGYLCILMASPIFYSIAAAIAYAVDRARKRKSAGTTTQAAVLATLFAVLALEGVTDATSFPRENEVVVSRVISANIAQVREKLAQPPTFDEQKPLFLRIFPYPTAVSGEGLEVGSERSATFVAYKHIWWTRVEGMLTFRVEESTPERIRFAIADDTSYLSHYLKWKHSEVSLEAIDATRTRITWRIAYERLLDPVWYFGPMQRYAVTLAAEELVDATTPRL